jgi:integrase
MNTKTAQPLSYEMLVLTLSTGERLPCVVRADSWIPAYGASAWIASSRRYKAQLSTLEGDARNLVHIYSWAYQSGVDLDHFLLDEQCLSPRQLQSLAAWLRENCATATFNGRLRTARRFLSWAMDHLYRGAHRTRSISEIIAEQKYLQQILENYALPVGPSQRHEPLSDEEYKRIRARIAPTILPDGQYEFCNDVFAPATRLRNWSMFLLAWELGLRRGELLKLKVSSLLRSSRSLQIRRHADDPLDTRTHEPATKTAERELPVESDELFLALTSYIDAAPPLGRGKSNADYLFVAQDGNPLATDTANDIIGKIGEYSGVRPLSWHRLRHSRLEKWAEALLAHPDGQNTLRDLGGWKSAQSMECYIAYARKQQADEELRRFQQQQQQRFLGGRA